MKNRLLITSCLFVVSLLFAACGDDSDSATGPADDSSSSIVSSSSVVLSSASKKTEVCVSNSLSEVAPSTVVVGNMTDSRDGQSYKTVSIGSQTWMAQNLNYETANSNCYNDSTKYCEEYGRLYTWAAATSACPNGWHLPTKAEFDTLFSAVGGYCNAGAKLKSINGWNDYNGKSGNGTDDYSFSALPAGCKEYYVGNYKGIYANFWSSTEFDSGNAYFMYLQNSNNNSVTSSMFMEKYYGFSVRCVKD